MLQYEESGWVGGCSSILMCKLMGILKIIYNALKLFRPRHFCWIVTSPECTIGLECIFYSPNNLFPKGSFCTLGARYIIIMIIITTIIIIIIIIVMIIIIIIMAMETLGPINETGITFVEDIGRLLTQATDEARETSFIFQRLSVTIQRFNAVAFCRYIHCPAVGA